MITEKPRCSWPQRNPADAQYIAYHDEEWGVPEFDDQALFEKLMLDGFQAGLSWITILRKRDNFRRAFHGFDPQIMASYGESDIERLMNDAGIVRNRAKITASVASAQAWLEIMEGEGFGNYLWGFVDAVPIQNGFAAMADVPGQTPLSQTISKELKAKGFKFCGPTIVYAFMQAVGMVNDHTTNCFRHSECAAMAKTAGKG